MTLRDWSKLLSIKRTALPDVDAQLLANDPHLHHPAASCLHTGLPSVFDTIPAQNTLLCQDNVHVVVQYRHIRFALSRAFISTADEDSGVFPLTVFLKICRLGWPSPTLTCRY
ncbi:hypothetical protein R3I94_014331 [Phoxinus phoxinus]